MWVVLPQGKMIAIKAGTTGTKMSVHYCTVIREKEERAGGILSHASDPRLAGFASADPAASGSPPLPNKAFCSKGLQQQHWEAQLALPLLTHRVPREMRTAAWNSRWAKDLRAKSITVWISNILLLLLTQNFRKGVIWLWRGLLILYHAFYIYIDMYVCVCVYIIYFHLTWVSAHLQVQGKIFHWIGKALLESKITSVEGSG